MAVVFLIKVGLFVRADSPIKSIKDMKGKTVAYGFTSQEVIKKTVDAMLATEGLTIADLKPMMMPDLVRARRWNLVGGRAEHHDLRPVGSAKVAEVDAAVKAGIRFHLATGHAGRFGRTEEGIPHSVHRQGQSAGELRRGERADLHMVYDYRIRQAKVPAERDPSRSPRSSPPHKEGARRQQPAVQGDGPEPAIYEYRGALITTVPRPISRTKASRNFRARDEPKA